MPATKSKVKTPIGMQGSWYHPIKEEPAGKRPVYDAADIDMGAAVKGYLTVTTASASIPGDDISQLEIETFVSAQLDAETTMSELEVNARIYGHTISEEGEEISKSDDSAPNGGYSFIQTILTKEKKTVYRATALLKVMAMPSTEKQEADTKKPGEIAAKNYAVSYKVSECETREWRCRKDFASYAEAKSYLDGIFHPPAPTQTTSA